MEIGGLHHVTAVTGNAAGNLTFYTKVLGMRLVKKTVNQDDVSAYHLFYADGEGNRLGKKEPQARNAIMGLAISGAMLSLITRSKQSPVKNFS